MNDKQKKNSRRIGALVISILMIIYIASQAYKVVHKAVDTEVAYEYTVEDTIDTDVFVVRKEVFITNQKEGTIIAAVDDGSRIAKGQAVAYVFTDPEDANTYTKLTEVNAKIERYTRLAAQSDNYVFDIDDLDLNIDNSIIDLVSGIDSGDVIHLADYVEAVRDKVVTRQIATGENFDFESRLSSLKAQQETLSKATINYSTISTNLSGYYVNGTDGFEQLIDYDDIKNIKVETVKEALKADAAETPEDSIGKVITEFTWYLTCVVDSNSITDLKVGDTITIRLPYSSENSINAKVYAMNTGDENETVIVFSSSLMNSDISTLRKESAELVVSCYDGLKIPASAIRVNDEGEKGVYVLSGKIAKFKKIDIIYSTDDYVLTTANAESSDYVRLYDEIITNGKDLYDGKVIE